jgi:hypothetical protein
MGRRKFSYKGKPHGRNELIKEYLWIAYLQTLAPGQHPDLSMGRTRKQVSSHIQVLKGFLREHPACKIRDLPLIASVDTNQLIDSSQATRLPRMDLKILSRMILV